ncbi:MAG: MerR family transcriptional regulator [Pseudomonadota bacterium]
MRRSKSYRVKQVAEISGLSIRTLHYYDEIGLLKPTDRTSGGYRLYRESDLVRLQQVMIGRSQGLSLDQIRRSLDEPDFDYARALQRQRAQLLTRLGNTHAMISAIDATLRVLGQPARPINLSEIFEGFDPTSYDAETQDRWGSSQAYAESVGRTKAYTDAEWTSLKLELDAIWSDAASAMQMGAVPTSGSAYAVVERHRSHVCRWFYELTPEGHVGLADLWEGDSRFRENIDKYGPGLTEWMATAVRSSAAG